MQAFCPSGAVTIASLTTSASRTAIAGALAGKPVRVKNRSTTGALVYIMFGTITSTHVTVATGMEISPGQPECFTLPEGATHVLAIAGSGTPDLELCMGSFGV